MSELTINRREFIRQCSLLSVLLSGTPFLAETLVYGFKRLQEADKPLVMFIQGQACTGCSISATYGNESDFISLITQMIRLQAHPNLSFAQGESYEKIIEGMIAEKGYFLVIEGAIPKGVKETCFFLGQPLYDSLKTAIENAAAVVLSGTCSSNGGIPAAPNNPTGSISAEDYIKELGLQTAYIKIPGCPAHPDRLIGTVAYIVATGKLPELIDAKPKMYYDKTIHEQCERFQFFTEDIYYDDLQKKGCLANEGCRGSETEADCPSRRWNGKVNNCIESNAPCIGCINPDFPFATALYG